MNVVVRRSVVRYWLLAVLAIPALLVAIDVSVTYRYFSEPEQDANGVFTNQGRSQRRADIAWGIGLGIGSVVLAGWSLKEVFASRRVLLADGDGLSVTTGSWGSGDLFIPWDEVLGVRSTIASDETGLGEALELDLAIPIPYPSGLKGGRWEGSRLLLDGDDWDAPVEQVAGLLQTMLRRQRRPGGG